MITAREIVALVGMLDPTIDEMVAGGRPAVDAAADATAGAAVMAVDPVDSGIAEDPLERALFRDGWLVPFEPCDRGEAADVIPGSFRIAGPVLVVVLFPRSPPAADVVAVVAVGLPMEPAETETWGVGDPLGAPGREAPVVAPGVVAPAAAAAAAACAAAAGPPAPPLSASQSRPSASFSKSSTPLPARYQLGGRTAAVAAAAAAVVAVDVECAFLCGRIKGREQQRCAKSGG